MNERRRAFLEELLYVVGDERWDLVVNEYHKGGDDFDYAIVHAGTGISMNRVHLGDVDYFHWYLGDYESEEMQEGTGKECYVDSYNALNKKEKEEMLESLHQSIIDELEAQGQYAPNDDEGVNVYSTAFFDEEEGDEDE